MSSTSNGNSMFQARHYEAVASILIRAKASVVRNPQQSNECLDLIDRITDDFGAMFAQDNPNFDSRRFAVRVNAA